MASVNRVIILGNLGADPETRYMQSGDAVASIRVATTESWKDKTTGQKQELTEWHRVNLFGRQAEVAGEYLKKGSQVYIEGSIRTRKWTDKDGVEKYSTEVKADTLKLMGSPPARDERQPERAAPSRPAQRERNARPATGQQRAPAGGGFDDMDGDIPF